MAYMNDDDVFLLKITLKGDSAYIRYSANSDGTDFTEELSEGQTYIGFATGLTAPTDKSDYKWFSISTEGAEAAANEAKKTEANIEKMIDELYFNQIAPPYEELENSVFLETPTYEML